MPSIRLPAWAKPARSPKRKGKRRPAWGKILIFALIFAALAAAWRFTPLSEFITGENISAWARAVRDYPWAPVIVILAYTPTAFLMFPRPVLTLFTVIAFGPWLGFVYGMVGVVISALVTYYAGRVLKRDTVKRVAGDNLNHAAKTVRDHGLLAMIAMRIVPAAPFAVEGIIAGAVRIKLWHYTLGTVLGMAPGMLATSVFGAQLTAALEDPSTINWWIIAAVVAVFVAMTYVVKRWLAARHGHASR
jgi:phospholipase D1/2